MTSSTRSFIMYHYCSDKSRPCNRAYSWPGRSASHSSSQGVSMTNEVAAVAALGMFFAVSLPLSAAVESLEIDVIVSLTGNGDISRQDASKRAGIGRAEHEQDRRRCRPPNSFRHIGVQSSPQVAVQIATDMIARKVPVILGPTLTAGCNAVRALLKSDGPVLYCFTPGSHPEQARMPSWHSRRQSIWPS